MKLRLVLVVLVALAIIAGCKKVAPTPSFQNEGSLSNPVLIYVEVPYNGTIAAFGTSYYRFVPDSDGLHTIALTNMRSDLDWYLYDSLGFEIAYSEDWGDASDEIVTDIALAAGETYYLNVEEWDIVAGAFTLFVFHQ